MERVRLSLHHWTGLEGAVRDAIEARVPGWVDENVHDPGIALLQLISFVMEELVTWRSIDPDHAAPSLARIADSVSRLEGAAPYDVSVDGVRWTRVATLAEAGPDDRVYSVDEHGGVLFGDGRQGRQPDLGSRIAARYREGVGQQENVGVTVRSTWPVPDRDCELSLRSRGVVGFRCRPSESG
jgi:hypothetical protein